MKKLYWLPLAWAAGIIAGCSSSASLDAPDKVPSNDAGAIDPVDRCSSPETACPCPKNGAQILCGLPNSVVNGQVVSCSQGTRSCLDGSWSECDITHPYGYSASVLPQSPVIVPAGFCTGKVPCDPYCHRYADESANFVCPGSGASVWDKKPNGPINGDIQNQITANGNTAVGWYHELAPGDTAVDPTNVAITLNTVDVYFLLNSTVAMKAPITNLASGIADTMTSIKASIPNVAFGLGRFTNYESWPYGAQAQGNVLYQNMVNINTNDALTKNMLTTMAANPNTYFGLTPYAKAQASIPALYAMASNKPLYGWYAFSFPGSNPGDAWYDVFDYYGSRAGASSAPFTFLSAPPYWGPSGATCTGGAGAPCFRANAYHIILLVQDAPAMNGPAGSFPYYQFKPRYFAYNKSCDYTTTNEWYWPYSPSVGATGSTPILPTEKGAAQAVTIAANLVGKPLVFNGRVAGLSSKYDISTTKARQLSPTATDYAYSGTAQLKCGFSDSTARATGPDVAYDFTVPSGGMRFWADTAGTSYDTLLYLINTSTGQVVGCMDDSLEYLSMDGCYPLGDVNGSQGRTNSALVGDLPAGNYRLILDKYDNTAMPNVSQEDGIYQLNLWPNMDDPKFGGNPKGTAHSTPSYTQALSALSGIGVSAMVAAIESSGLSCNEAPTDWEKAFARWSLEGIARDTGALNNGVPVVYSVRQNGTPGCASGTCDPLKCPAGASFGSVVASAITGLTQNLSQPITLIAVDNDDATDFDGPPNGAIKLTAANIDDASFVASVGAEATAGCTGPSGSTYASCLPGSSPKFNVTFAVPAAVKPLPDKAQIFQFRLEIHGANNTLIATQPVTIVVPPGGSSFTETDYEREFHVSDVCDATTTISWGSFSWDTETPTSSSVEFFLRVGNTQAELDAAAEIPASFALAALTPDTQKGAKAVGSFLLANGQDVKSKFLRIRAHLKPSSSATPILHSWSMEMDCLPP